MVATIKGFDIRACIAELRAKPQCLFVRQALDRCERDLKRKDIWFDAEEAQRAIDFVPLFKHYKGEYAGKRFELLDWQKFLVANVLGWKRLDGRRRFRTAYIEVPRKNGKTTLAAAIANYLLFADREQGAEVYFVATKEDQAKIGWKDSILMMNSNESFRAAAKIRVKHVEYPKLNGVLKPLGSDSSTLDGLNPSGAIFDELHEWKNRGLWSVISRGMSARRQPLIFVITTAGYNQNGICFERRTHGTRVLDGSVTDDSFFCLIYTIDDGDEPFDESTWYKANPSLGRGKILLNMQEAANEARLIPSNLYDFLNKDLNVWTNAEKAWISRDVWEAARAPLDIVDRLKGKHCFAGLDLSRTGDLTACPLVFPKQEGLERTTILSNFWLPTRDIMERERVDRVPYRQWRDAGFINVCNHGYINREFVRERLKTLRMSYDIRRIAYDRYGAKELIGELTQDGFTVEEFGQGFLSMSPAIKRFEELLLGNELWHVSNPVLDWNVGNVVIEQDASGNVKMSKKKSASKIDGAVAAAMGIGIMEKPIEQKKPSIYETRGIRTL